MPFNINPDLFELTILSKSLLTFIENDLVETLTVRTNLMLPATPAKARVMTCRFGFCFAEDVKEVFMSIEVKFRRLGVGFRQAGTLRVLSQ